MSSEFPERIVCLTEETTETLYLLGEEWRIVGISGFTVRPPRARKEKPRVSAFTSARIDKIIALKPDLVLGFSDLQADIAAELVRSGIEVHVFNHRSVADIFRMIRKRRAQGIHQQDRGGIVRRLAAGGAARVGIGVAQAREERVLREPRLGAHESRQRASIATVPSRRTRPSRSSFSRWEQTDWRAGPCSATGYAA